MCRDDQQALGFFRAADGGRSGGDIGWRTAHGMCLLLIGGRHMECACYGLADGRRTAHGMCLLLFELHFRLGRIALMRNDIGQLGCRNSGVSSKICPHQPDAVAVATHSPNLPAVVQSMSPQTNKDSDDWELDPLFLQARREMWMVLGLFSISLIWTISAANWLGYQAPLPADVDRLSLTWGMPTWVFWSVIAPWILLDVVAVWFCFYYMQDEPVAQGPTSAEDNSDQPSLVAQSSHPTETSS